jgi:hypothetical protein
VSSIFDDEDFETQLKREADADFERDPERRVYPSVGDLSWSTAARGGATEEHGLRGYVDDADDLRAAQAEQSRENARRKKAADRARSLRAQAGAQRGWETRRARTQAQAPPAVELS